jgi:hypothetical protein
MSPLELAICEAVRLLERALVETPRPIPHHGGDPWLGRVAGRHHHGFVRSRARARAQ